MKRLPAPGSDRAVSSPPISSASERQIARPRPGAAEAAGDGAVGLLEPLEQPRGGRRVEADAGVADLEGQARRRRSRRRAVGDLDAQADLAGSA